ncbi:SAM-dependent methyltransferase [Sphingomonas sp. RB1R13]|uniref:SAM-dependent methyltransferase n=1 Tax=Sphingomonas sp. RB1R13 TaxID=3096159 RepID=UPI002FC5DE76
MNHSLFDASLLPLRRARADAIGADYFLHERAFDECLDRIATVRRGFASALMLGEARPGWIERLRAAGVDEVAVITGPGDPLPAFAPELCVSVGYFDTADELPALLGLLRMAMAPGGLLIGAFAGGQSLPMLRAAMAAADRADGAARAHLHPMIDAASFGGLLGAAGFVDPVVDIDRVTLSYASLDRLVGDLRGMAATNRLIERPRQGLSRAGLAAARAQFISNGEDGRTSERIEIVQFSGWAPEGAPNEPRSPRR